jgi:hypothetical protein
MKTKTISPASHSPIGYVVLLVSSVLITFCFMIWPLSFPNLPMFYPSVIGGIGLFLLLSRFMKSFQPLPLFVTLLPLICLTGMVWYQQNQEAMPMNDLLQIWAGAMAGVIIILLLNSWINKFNHIAK